MITDVVKYFIMGTKQSLDAFFEKAQSMGFLEFVSVSDKKSKKESVIVENLLSCIKLLRRYPKKSSYLNGGNLDFAIEIANRSLTIQATLEKLHEEKRILSSDIARISPFGDFSIEDIRFIEQKSQRKVQFFCIKTTKNPSSHFSDEIICIGSEHDLDYFIGISRNGITLPNMIEMKIDFSLTDLKERLYVLNNHIGLLESELKEKTTYIDFLQEHFYEQLDQHHLNSAKCSACYPFTESVFFIEAWVPSNKVCHLYALIEDLDVHVEKTRIEKQDKVPTCIENQGLGYVGEDLVKIYDIPATTDKDPSLWVLLFFAFFFAIIVGDGGYGLILLICSFYFRKKFPKIVGIGKRMLQLLTILSITCIGWGVFTSSYFGLKFSPKNPLMQISPIQYLVRKKADYHLSKKDEVYQGWVAKYPKIAQAHNGLEMLMLTSDQKKKVVSYGMVEEFYQNIILDFTILLGIVHIAFGFLRWVKRHYAGIGWILFMIGSYFFCASILNSTVIFEFLFHFSKDSLAIFGKQALLIGLGFSVISSLIQHRWKGLGEIAHTIQIFSDVLSYLRLYALSLAGSIMASTFNQEGSALGFVIGLIVIFIGHTINMTLSFLGGVIHGLRLNFLEWYHYCFDGGGRLFNPLRKIKK